MGNDSSKNQLQNLHGLLCPQTLKGAFRNAHAADLPAREGLKELLSSGQMATNPAKGTRSSPDFARWDHCLELLVEEFLLRKEELKRLNKARRLQIEQFLAAKAGAEVSLESAVQSRIGSNEHEALRLFSYQASVFHLLQILLLKRWTDTGLITEKNSNGPEQTINWQITSFLKRNVAKKMLGRHDWSFLKQNIYSWFAPSQETRERLRLMLEPVNLAKFDGDFPAHFLQEMGLRTRLSLLGFTPSSIDSTSLWRLLLEQKVHDQRLPSLEQLNFASPTSGALLVSGLRNGESLNSLRSLTSSKELHDVWAFTDSEFERYLSEIFILWDSASEVPRINIHPRSILRESTRGAKSASLFQEGVVVPYHAQMAACFHAGAGRELDDCTAMLEQLREGGLLLIVSDQFWPTDTQDISDKMRDTTLRKSCLRLIIDLRQLSASEGETLPKGIFILEKCTSKEVRDSNRPQVLRARGTLHPQLAPQFWDTILDCVRQDSPPGEVSLRTIGSAGDGIKIESMAAAAQQLQLRNTPWNTLSDPQFYEASGRLRRSPSKAFTLGTILRWKPEMQSPSPRAVLLQEEANCLRVALPAQAGQLSPELPQFLFLPDQTMVEHPSFLTAQLYSAPIQFWYHLESEQNAGKKAKTVERQSEQRLKLMPLIRLFEPGTLLPVSSPGKIFGSLDEARSALQGIFRQPVLGAAERSRLHEIIISLERSIAANLENCAELSRHLFPELAILRWNMPSTLPQPAANFVFEIFRHLDQSPLLHHPAVHITRLRNVQDFKVTNVACEELPMGGLAELQVYHGTDAVLRLNGPSLILQATLAQIQARIGRPWREISDQLKFPTDFTLVRNQLQEVVKSIDSQLQFTREHIALLDQIFCCLFGLSNSFVDESARQTMRRHLSPEQTKIMVQFQKESPFRLADSEIPRGFLQ